MTIEQSITLLDRLHPNPHARDLKVGWLSEVDGRVAREILGDEAFAGYMDAPPHTTLLVPFPYDRALYPNYLAAMIHLSNGEITRYNQSITLFSAALDAYRGHHIRTNLPPHAGPFRFRGGGA